ncbi:MAG: tetratricopeptide repeat protein [Clostridia bacterium]|nr:tetratricopeptide repeat protein [Clostridia bacterium]
MSDTYLSREDYEEPTCPLCAPSVATPIPTRRVIEKLDEYLGHNDYAAAERHLDYWRQSAQVGRDRRGELTVLNEQIGLFRKMGREPECLRAIEEALALARDLGMERTVTFGTTLLNAATGYKAFGRPSDALRLYEQARDLYESELDPADGRLGGLYNNMALALTDLHDYRRAEELYRKAFAIMEQQEHGELEMAITYCNLADLVAAERGLEEGESTIRDYLEKADALLRTESLPRNGYFAFVCEKCAPTFGYYGFFLTEQWLTEQARSIYERT